MHARNGRFRLFKFRAGCSSVRQGPEWTSLSPRQNFFTPLDITFSDLFLHVSQDHRIGEQSTVNKVIMSDQPRNGGVEVELGAPVALCVEFSSKYVIFFVSENSTSTPLVQPAKVDAFRLLMSASTERSHLPSPIEPGEHRQLIATERLHNQVVDYMKSTGAGLVFFFLFFFGRSLHF